MKNKNDRHIVLGITGASGAYAARLFMEKSPWPVDLIATTWGRKVYEHECGRFEAMSDLAARVYENSDLFSLLSSGSVPSRAMVILPCTANTLGHIASGTGDSLVTRAAHCHLKERRPLVLCLRETPLTLMDINNAQTVTTAGGIIMPLCPPFYMHTKNDPASITLHDLMDAYVDRVFSLVGRPAEKTWEDVR